MRPYFVSMRGYWFDLTARISENDLGINLFDRLSAEVAIERLVDKLTLCVSRVEMINSYGED